MYVLVKDSDKLICFRLLRCYDSSGRVKIQSADVNGIQGKQKWTTVERHILLKYKRIHLMQQSHERQMLALNIMKALEYGKVE